MNLQEFKAWFDGFTENMKGPPTEKAWKRIQSRVAEITENPTEIRYFYDHYWRPYYYTNAIGYATSGYSTNTLQAVAQNYSSLKCDADIASKSIPMFASTSQAFTALGQAEASSLSI